MTAKKMLNDNIEAKQCNIISYYNILLLKYHVFLYKTI